MPDDTREESVVPAAGNAAIASDTEDLEQLYAEHASRVFRAAYRITGQAEEAEDVLQTVFLRLARRERLPDLSPSPGSYLHRAAVNAAIDAVRRRARAPHSLEQMESDPRDTRTASPEQQRRGRELGELLREALAELSPRSAEIFVLARIEGYGNREIAELVGTTPGSVAVLLHRAGRRLRERLQGVLGDHGETT